ncbi:MAG: HAD hydrolase family protein [Endomicrobiaceae bacterium]|nr:HAD hydrolase family protein [Endomicrobiaceae bacterium]
MKKYSSKILASAKKIKLIATDIDGVLTAGEVILLENNEEIKIWNIKDRAAVSYIKKHSPEVKIAWITGRKSKQVKLRAEELKIDYLVQSCDDKKQALIKIVKKIGIDLEQVAYIGDDIIDIGVLKSVGLAICPKDATDDVKQYVNYISQYEGGKGVFREACEIVLKSKGIWDKVLKYYL